MAHVYAVHFVHGQPVRVVASGVRLRSRDEREEDGWGPHMQSGGSERTKGEVWRRGSPLRAEDDFRGAPADPDRVCKKKRTR